MTLRFAFPALLAAMFAFSAAAQGPGPHAPVLKKSTWRVIYPARAVLEEQEGRVTYRLAIDHTGKVTSCVVTASSGHPLLDEATCRTARSASFEPALDANGSPTPAILEESAVYDLK